MEAFFVLIPIAIIVAILFRMGAGGLDRGRIREYVEARGGEFIDASWAPFGPGWFGEKSDRIYQIRYLDRDGNRHEAYAKTSLMTGVYLTEDRIVGYAKPPSEEHEVESLEEENRRLREELDRLKRGKGNKDETGIERDRDY